MYSDFTQQVSSKVKVSRQGTTSPATCRDTFQSTNYLMKIADATNKTASLMNALMDPFKVYILRPPFTLIPESLVTIQKPLSFTWPPNAAPEQIARATQIA